MKCLGFNPSVDGAGAHTAEFSSLVRHDHPDLRPACFAPGEHGDPASAHQHYAPFLKRDFGSLFRMLTSSAESVAKAQFEMVRYCYCRERGLGLRFRSVARMPSTLLIRKRTLLSPGLKSPLKGLGYFSESSRNL